VGHAEKWETIEIDGSLDARDCAVKYKKGGRTFATVTISRASKAYRLRWPWKLQCGAKTRGRLERLCAEFDRA